MTAPGRIAQPTGTPTSMRPHTEALAETLEHRAVQNVSLAAQIFRFGAKILANAGGEVVEVDVERRPDAWPSRPIPRGLFAVNPDGDTPLFVSEEGVIFRLESDLSLREVHRVRASAGGADASPLEDGRVLVCVMGAGTWLLAANGSVQWRVRRADPVLAALDDVVIAIASGEPALILCRDTATGRERWRHRGIRGRIVTLVAVVDDVAWISDGTAFVGLSLTDGRQKAALDPGVLTARPRLDGRGRAHLVAGTRHWTLDLRAGVISAPRVIAGESMLSNPYPIEALADGSLLIRDRAWELVRLVARDVSTTQRKSLWIAPALPLDALVHRRGLLVLTEPGRGGSFPPSRCIHWLAPSS
jgi:hypothetical protein